jgi:hypothetical protein
MKTTAERSVEALTWAAVVIWLGFALVTHLLGYAWLVVMVLGLILLSSAIYQRSRGWQTSLSLWISGIWMAVFSVVEVVNAFITAMNNGDGLNIDVWVYLGIALLSMGVAVVLKYLQAPSMGVTAADRRVASRGDVRAQTGVIPQQPYTRQGATSSYSSNWPNVSHEGTSSASWPPAGQDAGQEQSQAYGSSGSWEPQSGSWEEDNWDNSPRRTASSRRRTSRRAPAPRQPARPANQPSDLEARVEDIIRRSRERRGSDNLPY